MKFWIERYLSVISYSIVFFLFLISFTLKGIDPIQKKLPLNGYHGKVKEVVYTSYTDSIVNGVRVWNLKLTLKEKFTFDEMGNRLGDKTLYNKNESYTSSIYVYDKNGNKVKEEKLTNDSFLIEELYTYDEKNRQTSHIIIRNKTEVLDSCVCIYEVNGNSRTEECYTENKQHVNSVRAFYMDQYGNDTLTKEMFSYGKTEIKSKYDKKGNCIYMEYTTNGYSPRVYHVTHDEAGNTLETRLKSDRTGNKEIIHESKKYDLHGNMLEHNDYNYEGKITRYRTHEYTYDKYGNWLTDKVFLNGKQSGYKERVITYY